MENHSGILIIDKPSGWTSFDVCAKLRSLLHVKKVGHAGTLDPMATGVLVVLVGAATKRAEEFEKGDKEYVATVLLGVATDTDDIEGRVTSEMGVPEISRERLREVLRGFVGEIDQLPPAYSAIKVDGKALYKYARKGTPVEIKSRKVTIHSIDLLSFAPPEFTLKVASSKGTYIRALARDVGKVLGTCATLKSLRRTKASGFSLDGAITMDVVKSEEFVAEPEKWLK